MTIQPRKRAALFAPRAKATSGAARVASATALLLGGAVATAAGCSGTSVESAAPPSIDAGSIGLELTLPGGATLTTVGYTINGPNGFSLSGAIDVGNSPAITAQVGGLPPGAAYTITLTATSTDGKTSCAGSANFSVAPSTTVVVPVALRCVKQKNNGSVIIGGTVNVCPTIDTLSASPLSAPVGSTVSLSVAASDLDGVPAPLSYNWSSSSGTLSSATTAHPTFTCTVAGTSLITITVHDGDPAPNCPATQSFDIACTACSGNGTGCNDNNSCTINDTCNGSVCSGTAAPAATPCLSGGGNVCDGNGHCVQCVVAANCPGMDSACTARTCTSNTCGSAQLPVGAACGANRFCDGAGACVECVTAATCAGADTTCSQRTCVAGTCGVSAAPSGATCTENGGAICDGAGACVPLTVSVARVGAGGTGSLTLAAAPVFIETRNVADGSLVGTPIALPTAASGANQPLTVGGLAVTDAQLSRTADGHALLIAGYAAAPGSPNPVNNVAFARVVGHIDAAGAVDTSTVFPNAFIAGNIRSAVSADGTTLWAAGGSAAGTDAGANSGGIWTIQRGTAGGTQLALAPVRSLSITNGQLYAAGDATATPVIAAVGTGLPTTPSPGFAALPGFTGSSPWGFVFFDLNPAVSGLDTLYVASEIAGTGDAGAPLRNVQKWTFNGTTWALATTFNLPTPTGFRGITGVLVGSTPTIVATTADGTNSSRLVVFTDDGVTAPRIIAQSANNTFFRGVALSPR